MIPASVAEHFGASHHALPEFFREGRELLFAHAERAKPLPGKGNRHPSLLALDGIPGLPDGDHLVENSCQPRPSLCRLAKRKELIPTRERWHTGYDDVL